MLNRKVAVICTVLNEERCIRSLLDSLLEQTRRPDEIVFVDGGSIDGTVDVISQYAARLPLRCIVRPGSNISVGRNAAIAAADAEIIASTDAGVRLSANWLAELVAPFEGNDLRVDVVAGFFCSDPSSSFELAMGCTVLPDLTEIDPHRFLPSSRSIAFTKHVWKAVGGYPEWLDYCEDVVFDLALSRCGASFAFAPRALAFFRPRGTLAAFYKQYYYYARGDGKAGLWPRRHFVRYATYLVGALALLVGFWYKVSWFLVLLAGLVYVCRPYHRLFRQLDGKPLSVWGSTLMLVPLIRLVGDLAKMVGYPAGVVWRWQRGKIARS